MHADEHCQQLPSDPERESWCEHAEKEFTCMEHNVLCDWRPAEGSLKQAMYKENMIKIIH